ncbi:cytochrome P450 [Mycena leptocephala]|nr:cytochrome P450 [Mycena leptocephala]
MDSLYWLAALALVSFFIRRLFVVPSGLQHLPRVSIFPLLKSYLSMEPEDIRIRNLILPFANDQQEGVVLVWVLGRWMVHILDQQTQWKKQSRLINDAINLQIPAEQFVALAEKRFAIDALGSTVFGHDFEALKEQSMFVREYNGVMSASHPSDNAPQKNRYFDRAFCGSVKGEITLARDDMKSYMLRDPDMSQKELRDNMILLILARARFRRCFISWLHPDIQRRAREEIVAVVGKADFTAENFGANSLPFLNACIRESLRINTPISYVVPRMSTADTQLGKYAIPAGASITVDIYAIHHDETFWKEPHAFKPERFEQESLKSWVPFALGLRQCPARNFAMYEQRVLAAVLLRDYEWELPSGSKHSEKIQNAFSPFALTVPHELRLTFRKL